MSLFRKIFGSKSDQLERELKTNDRGKYMPEIKLPVDERFTINFKENGGKFLYCENLDEIYDSLNNIILENDWEDNEVLIYDEQLRLRFENSGLHVTRKSEDAAYFLTTCENLIADDGSLLISSNQIAEKKLVEFPEHFVVFATTSQMIGSIGEGLRGIKNNNSKRIPTNITTIKNFKTLDDKDKGNDFMSYGSNSKNLYLLLLEDL
ncbi:lactate utilization protein B/C [Bizionia argentinensis JUB59]|uniref:Lactate utilization protein B/C n=1 Tax=Bizionia argentinensis JUB59 TaxID=1046627 RepID=G2EAB0_9FLAO|nr:LUD domain-containing protein [Bizionia argentinensis]EGV44634.1 lactate utilization protein B/C [Bizionia argentinensis JUB59]